mgnify:CR=1 FL=1
MASAYKAVIQRDGKWWIGWMEEVPGVNAQARTRAQLLKDLRSALEEALEMNRADALAAASGLVAERDFHVVVSPARVFSGRVLSELASDPKLCGGPGPEGARRAGATYCP